MTDDGASIERLTQLTDTIQSAMDEGEWKRAAALAAQRLEVLRALFSTSGASGVRGELFETLLREAQAANYRLIGEVDHHRRRLQREAELEAAGHHAVERYAETSRET